MLQDAIERIFVGDIYGDIYAGIYVIRGENVVLLGEIVPYPAQGGEAYSRIWTKKMRNYHNVECREQKPKKPSMQKSNFENEKNGLKTEFSVAWYPPPSLHKTFRLISGIFCERLDVGGNESILKIIKMVGTCKELYFYSIFAR